MKLQGVRTCLKRALILPLAVLTSAAPMVAAAADPLTAPANMHVVSTRAADFAARCAAPGVLVCEGFDSQAAIDGSNPGEFGNGFFWNGITPAPGQGTFDTAVKYSGAGSLRFNVPDARAPVGAGNAGQYVRHFGDNVGGHNFGQGDTLYLQFKMKLSPEMLTLNPQNTDGASGWKQAIVHTHFYTCGTTELTLTNIFTGRPTWYTACGAWGVENALAGNRYQKQQGDYGTCIYPDQLSSNNCWFYTTNEWLTFYWEVHIGTVNGYDSHLIMKIAREKGPFETVFDKSDFRINDYDHTFDSITLTPYMNNAGAITNPQAYVWYDELIVSTQPIAAPKFGIK